MVRVQHLDCDLLGGVPELLRYDLPQGRVGAGALIEHGRANHDAPVLVQRDGDRRLAPAGRAVPHRDAAAHARGRGACVVGPFSRRFQSLASSHVAVVVARDRLVALLDQVVQPELERVHPDCPRDAVDVRLGREDPLRLRRRAHLASRDVVRVHPPDLEARVRDLVEPRAMPGRAKAGPRPKPAVRPAVEHRVQLVGHQSAVAHHSRLQAEHACVARRRGGELLHVVHPHLHRASAAQRQEATERLVERGALRAEIASHHHGVHHHLFDVQAQRPSQYLLEPVRRLVGRPHLQLALVVLPGDAAVRLHIGRVHPGHGELVLHDHV